MAMEVISKNVEIQLPTRTVYVKEKTLNVLKTKRRLFTKTLNRKKINELISKSNC